jgi:hypothetical protein
MSSLITWDKSYTIDKTQIETNNLIKLINKSDPDFPNLLKCYTINYPVLSNLLNNYKNMAIDELTLITKKGGNRRKRNKTKKRKRKSTYNPSSVTTGSGGIGA